MSPGKTEPRTPRRIFMKMMKCISGSIFVAALMVTETAFAQTSTAAVQATDPGVQAASRGTGAALPSVLANDNPGILAFFKDGQSRFQEVESVSGAANNGLGPRFNATQCSACHAQPAVGGSG